MFKVMYPSSSCMAPLELQVSSEFSEFAELSQCPLLSFQGRPEWVSVSWRCGAMCHRDTWVLFCFGLFSRKPFHGCSEIRGLEPKNKNNNNLWWKSRCGAHFLLSYLQHWVKGYSIVSILSKNKSSRFILTLGKLQTYHFSELFPHKKRMGKNTHRYIANHTVTANLISVTRSGAKLGADNSTLKGTTPLNSLEFTHILACNVSQFIFKKLKIPLTVDLRLFNPRHWREKNQILTELVIWYFTSNEFLGFKKYLNFNDIL